METKNLYKQYSREFKIAAVEMTQEPGRTIAQVAQDLEIREKDLHAWCNSINENGDEGNLSELKHKNERLREENAILKKAAISFAQETKRILR